MPIKSFSFLSSRFCILLLQAHRGTLGCVIDVRTNAVCYTDITFECLLGHGERNRPPSQVLRSPNPSTGARVYAKSSEADDARQTPRCRPADPLPPAASRNPPEHDAGPRSNSAHTMHVSESNPRNLNCP